MYQDILKPILQNEPKYRLKQVKHALFCDLIDDWNKATNLPPALRQKLNDPLPINFRVKFFGSPKSKTVKALMSLNDGLKIETVLMHHSDGRNTVCVSSQAGCQVACAFCATGKLGFKRNLWSFEIAAQVLLFSRYLKNHKNKRVSNVVFMGMGEPFLNYEQVISAIKILNDKDGLNIGARKISISTCGIISGIKKLSKEKLQVNLAISLHAPNDDLRKLLIPAKFSPCITELLRAIDDYIKHTGRRVMLQYLMINGLNDSPGQAAELIKLIKNRPLYFINLIPYNLTQNFKASSKETVKKFKDILLKAGIAVTERYRFGADLSAACGQLAGRE